MSGFQLLIHWCVSALAILVTSAVIPGFKVGGFLTALVASLLLALANSFVRPVLVFLTFPLTILTLGLFIFVVDAMILRLCAAFLKNFEFSGWLSAIFAAIVLAVVDSIFHWVLV